MADPLVDNLGALLDRAVASAVDDGARARLVDARVRLTGPLRLAIAGKVKAGKSTLLNAILGDELAPTDAGECTKIVTWYHEGTSPQVKVYPLVGEAVVRPWSRDPGALDVDLGDLPAGGGGRRGPGRAPPHPPGRHREGTPRATGSTSAGRPASCVS